MCDGFRAGAERSKIQKIPTFASFHVIITQYFMYLTSVPGLMFLAILLLDDAFHFLPEDWKLI